jgi:hypothetical protein
MMNFISNFAIQQAFLLCVPYPQMGLVYPFWLCALYQSWICLSKGEKRGCHADAMGKPMMLVVNKLGIILVPVLALAISAVPMLHFACVSSGL